MKKIHLIKEISNYLLQEEKIEKVSRNERNGYRLTNDYNDNVTPIGMLDEEEITLLKSYFKGKLKDFYYVEKL